MEMKEGRFSKPEDRSTEFTKYEQQRYNRLKKTNLQRTKTCRTILKDPTFISLGSQERRNRIRIKEHLNN